MDPTPLTPTEVDALLRDPRSTAADMLVLRDALERMAGALERLADAVGRLDEVTGQLRPTDGFPQTPPRADCVHAPLLRVDGSSRRSRTAHG